MTTHESPLFIGVDPPRAACLWTIEGPVFGIQDDSVAREARLYIGQQLDAQLAGRGLFFATIEEPYSRHTKKPAKAIYSQARSSGWLERDAIAKGCPPDNVWVVSANVWRSRLGINRANDVEAKRLAIRLSRKARADLGASPLVGDRGAALEHASEADCMCIAGILEAYDRGLIESRGVVEGWRRGRPFGWVSS